MRPFPSLVLAVVGLVLAGCPQPPPPPPPPAACTSNPECDDGLFCNGAETCNLSTGECQPGTPPSLDDGISCTVGSCDEATDTIVQTPDDSLCNDSDACTTDVCQAGVGCVNTNTCTVCGNGVIENGEACDDHNTATGDGCDDNCQVESGWHCHPDLAGCVPVVDSCAGKVDFTPCDLVTSTDRSYDICSNGTCVSPGCGNESCNAPGPSFTSSGSGTHFTRTSSVANEPVVLDGWTGLMWQGCARGQSGDACTTGAATSSNWQPALAYCDDLSWGGYTDWRLPSDFELYLLHPTSAYFPASPTSNSGGFWTSTYTAGSGGGLPYIWVMLYSIAGGSRPDYPYAAPTDGYFARCVRTETKTLNLVGARFTRSEPVTNEPVVADATLGVLWQGCEAGLSGSGCATGTMSTMTWAVAQSYCAGLNWGGYTGWSTPAIDTLRALVDTRAHGPALTATAFPGSHVTSYLSSQVDSTFPNQVVALRTNLGFTSTSLTTSDAAPVRCVRPLP